MSGGNLEIKDVVELLRGPPFNRTEGLVEFSKKSPLELLQVVSDVFGQIDDRQKKDVRDETKEAMTARMLEFVNVLGYKIEGDPAVFGDSFMRGVPSVVYPFLLWSLQNYTSLVTRAYLSRYLRPFSIPEEHFADASMVSVYQQYAALQGEFKEVHMALESARKDASQPQQLAKEVQQLDNEKEQLQAKLDKMRTRMSTERDYAAVDFDAMLGVTNKLRQEQEAEARLYGDMLEQKQKLQRAEQTRAHASRRLQELSANDMSRADPHRLLAKLRDEVNQRRAHLENRVEQAINDKERQLRHLAKTANNAADYTAEDLHQMERERAELQHEVDSLTQRRENSALANDSKLNFIRDRLTGIEKKRDKLREEVAELEDEKREAEADLRKLAAEFSALSQAANDPAPGGIQRPKTDAQMKEYMAELNKKTARYKALKAELEAERVELAVLQRTEEVLRTRASNIEAFNAEQEARLGVVGYSSTAAALEGVSAQKAQLDASKGATLEEMSEVIARIAATIKRKSEALKPQIKELQAVRADFSAVEQVYKQRRLTHDNAAAGFEQERNVLADEVTKARQAIHDDESSFHFLHALQHLHSAKRQQIEHESDRYRALYEAAIHKQEVETKQLRTEKRNITEKHEERVAQRGMFAALKSILNKKLEVQMQQQQQQQQGNAMAGQQIGAQHSYFSQLAEETDRLIIDQTQ